MKAYTNLSHFLVSLLPLLLQLDSLLLVHQQLVSLWLEGKTNFPVAPLGLPSITCVMEIRAVHVALIIYFMHVYTDNEGLELQQLSGMKENKSVAPAQEVRYAVTRHYMHEWKCIPPEGCFVGDLAKSHLQQRPHPLTRMLSLVQCFVIYI